MQTAKRNVKRTGIAIVGGAVLLVGIIAIPYPGPGWIIVFAGLAILATEFTWAQRLLDYARGKYEAWGAWLKRQHLALRLLILTLTGMGVVTTMWLFNVFGILDSLLHLNTAWLHSPLGIFRS
jgi:uncharacterized protein (TIGR02611 family)